MLFEIVLVGGFLWLAHKTRPHPQTFSKYYSTLASTKSKIGGLFERLLGGRAQNFTYTDLLFAWLVRVEETGQLFIGIFGIWISLGEGAVGVEDRVEMGTLKSEDKHAELQREANTLKATGKYEEAAKLYEKIAGKLTSSDPYTAAELYDESARCRKMLQDTTGYEAMSIKAAELFRSKNRNIRAAGLYDKLAKHYTLMGDSRESLQKAADYYKKCRDLYEIEDDSRAEALCLEIYTIQARLGEYRKAAEGFAGEADRVYKKDAMFVNQSQRYLLFAVISFAMEDQVFCCRKVSEFVSLYPWFGSSREGRWAIKLCEALRGTLSDESHVEGLEEDLRMMASMPPWFDRAWLVIVERLKSQESDLT